MGKLFNGWKIIKWWRVYATLDSKYQETTMHIKSVPAID